MSENKFIKRLKGEQTAKSVLEIKNESAKTSFANMPQGTSNAIDVFSDHRSNATAVLNGTTNWKISNSDLLLVDTVSGDGQDFTSTYSVSGAGLWVNASYTFPSTGDPRHPVAMVFNPSTKWVLKVCGDNLIVDGGSTVDFTMLVKIGTASVYSKNFTIRESAGQFSKEFIIDFGEANSDVVKAGGLSTLTVQLLCGTANASARIYNGMTVLTCLQRKVDASAVSSSSANVEDVLDGNIIPSDYFSNPAFINQIEDGDTAVAIFARDGDDVNLDHWEQPIPDRTGNAGKFLQTPDGDKMSWEDVEISDVTGLQTALNGKQDTISDLSTIRSNAQAGKAASDTIATYGDIVTHDVAEFATAAQGAKADTAVQPSDLATVATTGSYTDLSDKPTIGNATLTIQKNSTTIDTFTANATSNKTINITVPTKTSDITNDSDYQNSTQVATAISTHNTSATAHSNQFNAITDKIPAEASSSNKLADKAFVNSSIATNTANFIGTFNSVAELEAYSGTVTNNDYAFVIVTDSAGNTAYDRYKYTTATTPASWVFEYELNNSSFTATQWAAINSGANTTNIGQIATNTTTISNHIGNTSNPHQVTKAQVGLGNVDNTSDLAKPISTATQTALNAKANIADLATVATSGSYNDLSDKPTIPTVNNATLTIQKNGTTVQTFTANQGTNATANISVPTKTSDITNDSGFITSSALAPYALSADLATVATSGDYDDLSNKPAIPTVGNGTITITQGGISKGTFTTNQSGNTTIALDAGGGGIGNIDNLTITANADDEIQAVAVIDQNTGIAKTWTGTMAEYEAIVTKDPETEYIITDDIGGSATEIAQITEALNNKVDKGFDIIEFQEPTAANGYTWYKKYRNGWVEQGGTQKFTAAQSIYATVNLPVEMANSDYTLVSQPGYTIRTGTNAGQHVASRNGLKTTTTIFIAAYGASSNDLTDYIDWQVSGMAA